MEADGSDKDVPPAPTVYLRYIWRRKMHTSYLEMLTTPFEVIMQDLTIMSYESKYGRPKQQAEPTNKQRINP